jgi:putative cardiolipin synthase
MLSTLIGTRLPQRYRKYFDLPPQMQSWTLTDSASTTLGAATRKWLSEHDKPCGVLRLDFGLDALSARIGLIEVAESSIDIQSYLISDDLSGNLVALRLMDAADRGVRVRLLMDDALTESIDSGLLTMDKHPNIEVRVFNPFPRRRSRLIALIAYFNILNRRMHNKSFTVDNRVTIVGGRNIADEYFQIGGEVVFLDEDILAIGAIVDEVSSGFDDYWNTPEAIPISVFDSVIESEPYEEMVAQGREYLSRNQSSAYIRAVNDGLLRQLLGGTLPLTPAEVELVMDRPDKVRKLVGRSTSYTSEYLRDMVSAASDEIIIISPYFVPQKQGVDFLGSLAASGVRVVIVTNSLASTNHSSVHAVYARYRKPLLRAGVELYELRPQSSQPVLQDSAEVSHLTLHSKVAVVDGRRAFVGSFNLDPRSLYLNTEMGVVVESTGLATSMASSITERLPQFAYRLGLSEKQKLQWRYRISDGYRIDTREPHTSVWRRIATRLLGLLPIEGQM